MYQLWFSTNKSLFFELYCQSSITISIIGCMFGLIGQICGLLRFLSLYKYQSVSEVERVNLIVDH